MRILHITDSYEYMSGVRTYLDALTALMRQEGHAVEIYSPPGTGDDVTSWFSRWISVRHTRAFARRLDDFRPDVVHAHNLSLRLSPLPLRAAAKRRIPVVMTVHDFNMVCPRKWMMRTDGAPCPNGFGARCLFANCPAGRSGWRYLPYHDLRWLKLALHRRMLMRWVNVFITPSALLGEWMARSLGPPHIAVVPNFTARPEPAAQRIARYDRLLFVGRLSKEKGVACLLRAMPHVLAACPGVRLTVVGEGPERTRLEGLAGDLALGDNFRFVGGVDRAATVTHYEQSTVVVLPSLWMENCPMAGLEALSFGRPLVGSDLGGIPELIQDGRTGFVFRANDHEELADRLLRLTKDSELVNLMGDQAVRLFDQRFSPEQHMDRIMESYETARRCIARRDSIPRRTEGLAGP